jgi:hypothetical protein
MLRLRKFFSGTSWSRDKRIRYLRKQWAIDRFLSTSCIKPQNPLTAGMQSGLENTAPTLHQLRRAVFFFRHKSVTPTSLSRQKVPKIVGARGFEPRASWSQIISGYLFQRKKGDSESGRVHTAHTVHEGAEKLTQICHSCS